MFASGMRVGFPGGKAVTVIPARGVDEDIVKQAPREGHRTQSVRSAAIHDEKAD